MPLPTRFSLLDSEFNGFLFAVIGDEGNAMPLSVLSALTRLDLDPWSEAARLAMLPKAVASHALAATIARLPSGLCAGSDTESIAARLVELLPHGQASRAKDRAVAVSRFKPPFWLYGGVAVAALLLAWIAVRLWLR